MEAQNRYKKYRNLILILLKENKQIYFTIYFFQENIKDLKKIWIGIKYIKNISLKSSN